MGGWGLVADGTLVREFQEMDSLIRQPNNI